MRILIIKYLNIAVVMAFEAWFLWPKDGGWVFEWEPLIGIIISLTAYIGVEAKDYSIQNASEKNGTSKITVPDIKLLDEFSKLFTAEFIAFFRDHDFMASFHPKPMKNLFYYVDHWTTVEHEFVNPTLQKNHRIFREEAIQLAQALAENTSENKNGHATVRPSGHKGGPLPDWAKEQARELNVLAAEFAKSHQEFIKNARRIMY